MWFEKLMGKYPVQHLRSECPNIDSKLYDTLSWSSTTHTLLNILQSAHETKDDSKKFVRLLILKPKMDKNQRRSAPGNLGRPRIIHLYNHIVADFQINGPNLKNVDDTTFFEIYA